MVSLSFHLVCGTCHSLCLKVFPVCFAGPLLLPGYSLREFFNTWSWVLTPHILLQQISSTHGLSFQLSKRGLFISVSYQLRIHTFVYHSHAVSGMSHKPLKLTMSQLKLWATYEEGHSEERRGASGRQKRRPSVQEHVKKWVLQTATGAWKWVLPSQASDETPGQHLNCSLAEDSWPRKTAITSGCGFKLLNL